jgi:hypothetical protein
MRRGSSDADRFWSALSGEPLRRPRSPAVALVEDTPPTPIKLTHFHTRKYLDPGIRALMPDSSPDAMKPPRMQPGYVLPDHPARQSLQAAVTSLLQTKYAGSLAPDVHLRLALVDLTEAKQHTPTFAGFWAWGQGASVEGGSLPKILPLYAVFQMRADLNTFARNQSITTRAALQTEILKLWRKEGLTATPDFGSLFRFREKAGTPVVVEIAASTAIHSNDVARALILGLSFEYIGSVALQSGLFDESAGGLWLNGAYNFPAETFTTSPFPKLERHNVTAHSAATYFTLLAQGRLVDQATSSEIFAVLKKVQCMKPSMIDGIDTRPGLAKPVANKCGILDNIFHEAIYVERQVPSGKRLAYVIAVLTQWPPPIGYKALGLDLDGLIAAANP